jgi:hypothetical protein
MESKMAWRSAAMKHRSEIIGVMAVKASSGVKCGGVKMALTKGENRLMALGSINGVMAWHQRHGVEKK